MTNDQRDPEFERDLRGTLDRLMAEPAPAALRARVERTLASGEPSTDARRPGGRLSWLGAALVILVLAAVPLVMNLASRQPGVAGLPTPSATASPSASASGDATPSPLLSPSASPTGLTAEQIGLPLVNLSGDVVRKTRVDSTDTGTRPGGPPIGPYLYDWPHSGSGTSHVTDIGGGSIRLIEGLPVGRDEAIAAEVHNGAWIVLVVVPSNLSDCRYHPTTPLPWRIEVAAMGADGLPGAFHKLASGTEQSAFDWFGVGMKPVCSYPMAPILGLSGDLLAWSKASGPALDAGSDVTLTSLATSATLGTYRSTDRVLGLEVSDQALAWLEATNLLVDSQHRTWRVMEARLPGGTPSPVDIGTTPDAWQELPEIALDGTAIVAGYADAQGNNRIVRVDGGQVETITPAAGVSCNKLIAADAGRVVVRCDLQGKDNTSYMFLAVWTHADGLRGVTLDGQPVPMPPEVSTTDGWVTWYAFDFAAMAANDQLSMAGEWMALPIDALAAPVR